MLPLLAGQDPGARDCLNDNRAAFQSAFAPEAYAEFVQSVNRATLPPPRAFEESRQETWPRHLNRVHLERREHTEKSLR